MMEKISYERYSRQTILKGFGEDGQRKLAAAKVVVIGCGGLGCPALQYLVAAGLGTIGMVDDDVVSLSNLHRQVLYATPDIGRYKADVAAAKLKELNPDVKLVSYKTRLQKENALDVIRAYDIVIDGTDNFASRYMTNDACVLLNKPLIYGAVSQFDGQVAVFNADGINGIRGVNYRDLFPHPPKRGEVLSCAEAGVLGVLPGIIGTMQAAEAIKLITGIGKPLINRLLTFNMLTNLFYELSVTPSPAGAELVPKTEADFLQMEYDEYCVITEDSLVEIGAEQFENLRKMPSTLVIDVREKGEQPLVTNFEHRQIPMSTFKESIAGIEAKRIILFCQHGIRSLYAAELLQEAFGPAKDVYSLKGGLVKWGQELGVW